MGINSLSLCRHGHAGSWWEDGPDALVVVAVFEQRPLLRVAESGASDQVALGPLCITTGEASRVRANENVRLIAAVVQFNVKIIR